MKKLECPICLDIMTDPVTAPCGHAFCKVCIESAIKKMPKCVFCREEIPKDYKFRISYLLQDLIEEFRENE